ncbi:unnamed protein product [Acanthoscelides obtectus]|uniref:Uncharacterized protein n=1 Tax=Acanthoscelides obtectus TaxID=200917 RepID=A0A9P0MKD9_ACAOB|nr:unnamed protein product [Acanthoscelides obtectus]CAK1664692.1 hypothetical protein AOBTE_LOCUS24416 [Acanthoscelides obtectus]
MSVNIVPPTGAIIHFEATGSVCRKPQSFKKNNNYSIDLRCHQSTIPNAELITSQQNICSISLFFKMKRRSGSSLNQKRRKIQMRKEYAY